MNGAVGAELVLNKDVVEDESESEDPNDLSEKLLDLLLQACKAGVREGVLIETQTRFVRESSDFRDFQALVPRLSRVQLTGLSPTSALAFWLNVHNMLTVHSRVLLSETPKKKEGVLALHQNFKYRVGGRVYSGSDIEIGVMRASSSIPNESPFIGTVFAADDARRVYSLLSHEPRIVFALYRGTESCPDVRVYNPASLNQDLDDAAKRFLEREAFVDAIRNEAWVPKLLLWHKLEFGPKEQGLKEIIKKYLQPTLPDFSIKNNKFLWEFEMHPWYVAEEREKAEKVAQEQRERELQVDKERRKKERRHTSSHHRKESDTRHTSSPKTEKRDRKEDKEEKEEKTKDKEKREKEKDKENLKEKEKEREKGKDERAKEKEERKPRKSTTITFGEKADRVKIKVFDRESKHKEKEKEKEKEKDKDKGKDSHRRDHTEKPRDKNKENGRHKKERTRTTAAGSPKDARRMSL